MSAMAADPDSPRPVHTSGRFGLGSLAAAPSPGRQVDTKDWPERQNTLVVFPATAGTDTSTARSPLSLLDEHLTLLAMGT